MRFKQLEIFGFKSFAQKTAIRFEPGVTAIVGPNGSGKCVHGSSRVVLADGRVVRIDELVETALQTSAKVERWDDGYCTRNNAAHLQVLSLHPTTLTVESRPITAFIKRTSPEILYRFVTRTGRELIATGYHPLFTLDHGQLKTLPADQLRIGMRIAIPRRLPVSQTNDRLDFTSVSHAFERSDSVYLPHSSILERWVTKLSEQQGSLAVACRAAGVNLIHVRSVYAGQALNIATIGRLAAGSPDSALPEVGSTLQASRGDRGAMKVPAQLSPQLARFLGYCISEGRVTSANQVWFVNSDPALVQDFCQCTRDVFGLQARVFSYKATSKDVLVFSRALCRYLQRAFQMAVEQPSSQKQVPDVLLSASDDCVKAFLSALFEGDGHIAVKVHPRTGRTTAYVEYATASRRLAEDVCLLLARFGVVGRIASKWKAATNTQQKIKRQYFSVFVYGVEQLKMLASVLEFHGQKREALERLKRLQQPPNSNDDLIPGVTPLVKDLVRRTGVSVKRVRRAFPTLAAYYEGRCEATRPGLLRVLDAIDACGMWSPEALSSYEHLRTLATSDVYWDEIVHIEPQAGEQWVYDLAVEGHHNFIANGIIVHNSNIVDSIRWVLGEHNPRDVRAPRLEDVIFNGTDRRAPLSMAEVQLTIDNAQGLLPIAFTEVTVTRRVFRSGESEYLINQSPCRLKDIQELFLGTGLGGGTYAIIEQGHIDMVLSSKPEERRIVFEEASGIAKYLTKKQETIRRLDEVEEHLVRIADVTSEVRRQVGALERAANKARQYKSQWEQLKDLELRLAVDELSSGETRSGALERQLQELNAERERLESQKQSHMSSLDTCNSAVSALQQQAQELRTNVVEHSSQIEQHESQFALKTTWIEELKQQVAQLEREEAQLRERLGQCDEQLSRLSGGESEIQAQWTTIQEQLTQGGEELTALEQAVQAAVKLIDEAKGQLFNVASEASHQRNVLTQTTSRLQHLEAQLARVEGQRSQRVAAGGAIGARRDEVARERQAVQAQADEMQRRHSAIGQALAVAGERRHELTGRLHQLREQLASHRAQASLLEDLWKRYEGFPETVKTLMAQSIDGLIGPLVDVVQAVPGYEEVVEASLGPLAEALVVRDRQALTQCRGALRAQQLDGCRFLVLADCPTTSAAVETPSIQGGVLAAVKQYIRADAPYQPLVDWLLNDSWVVEDLERLLGDGVLPQGRLVSAQGDRWDRRSWRFRGAAVRAHSRIGRKQRWEQAHASLQSLEQDVSRLEAETRQAEQEWQSQMGQQESIKAQLAQVISSLQKLDAHLSQLAHEAKRIEDERRAYELEAQELSAQQGEVRTALGQAQRAVEEAQARQQSVERALADAQAARETAQQRQQHVLVARAQVEATLQGLTQRLETLRSRRQELESDRAQLAQQAQGKESQRQETLARLAELAAQLTAHQDSSRQLQDARVSLEAEAQRATQTLRDAEAKRDQVVPHVLAVEQQLSSLLPRIQEQTQQLSERTFRRSRLIERLRELYQIDEAAIQAQQQADNPPVSDEQRAAMAEQVQKLRAKLEGLGPVSLGSVEEYDELKRRLEFLQTQQQDLVQARDDLKASITQINRAARTQFRETFERIKQEFQHYYTRLFNGGQADLILLDEEDVLECGIDIVARPPGKRLQNISLLSGGERALTAISLLFALFKVRPSPFCILDEIDAPLDEANVDRFTRVLEEFLALSQFILITHNKKTITKADSLYGVTMEEPGISKILSAKLARSTTTPNPS